MSVTSLTAAISRGTLTSPLIDGQVKLAGASLVLTDIPISEILHLATQTAAFDISEVSLARSLIALSACSSFYQLLPIFPHRSFRHDAIYVAERGPRHPRDLRGGRIGIPRLDQTAVMTLRGILQDQYSLGYNDVEWVVGPVNSAPSKVCATTTTPLPPSVKLLTGTRSLSILLAAGEIDALISLETPVNPDGAPFQYLFDDPSEEARAYYNASGVLPIMHAVGLARRVHEGLATERAALRATLQSAFATSFMMASQATNSAVVENHAVGIEPNRPPLEAAIRWACGQGLVQGTLNVEELFE